MRTKEFPVSFGDWLKQRRTRLDLTQAELAERVHCSVFALRKIESGERRPSKQLAAALAAGLEISQEQFPTFLRVARGELSVERLAAKDSSSASAQPAQSKTRRRRLPWQATVLLGRENEIAAIDRLFTDPQCRLLTLTGMGGIGKTRLAIEYAWRQSDRFPGGAVYVPLAPVESPDLIAPAMAEALGLVFSGPVDLMGQVIEYLSSEMGNGMLLVLDNLEHLTAQSTRTAEIIAEMLQQLPKIKILATSRERINLHGEWMFELHGLPVPPMQFSELLDRYSAAELFIQGAKRSKPSFEPGESDHAAIVRICNLLDGIPLAIELAAAWAGMLSCEEIAGEIESNMSFLSTSMRDLPDRHRSMRASFEHSWKLLAEQERQVLGKLAVFQGGFLREAAEAVAQAPLQVLATLVSKSLVRRRDDGRYDLHEVIRQNALSNLKDDAQAIKQTRDRHCEYHMQMVAEREMKLKSSAQQETLRELSAELDNMLAAWNWGIETGQTEALAKAVRGLGWLFEVAGMLNEGIELFEAIIQKLGKKPLSPAEQAALGQARAQQGLLLFRKGHFPRAIQRLEESLEVLRPLEGSYILADGLIYLGVIRHLEGDLPGSRALLEEGLRCARRGADDWFSAYAIYNLGYIDGLAGHYAEAYRLMQEAMKTWERLGDPHSLSLGMNYLAPARIQLGLYDEAQEALEQSLSLCEETGNRWGMGTAYRCLGLVMVAKEQYREAGELFRKSLETFGDYTEGWDIASSYINLGNATRLMGYPRKAKTIYKGAMRMALEIGAPPIILDVLTRMAELEMQGGRAGPAWEAANPVISDPRVAHEVKMRAQGILLDAERSMPAEELECLKQAANSQSMIEVARRLLAK